MGRRPTKPGGAEAKASAGNLSPAVSATITGGAVKASAGDISAGTNPTFITGGVDPTTLSPDSMTVGSDDAANIALHNAAERQRGIIADTSGPTIPLEPLREPPANILPPIESIPEQERTGTRFDMDAEGRIDVVRIPPA